ncbi:hypothetical protein HYC85_015367 [Camellia sinensis]|uniref:Major facilitator superfamily (MFS) profile domain-containing protein n=1 Tax=Camellia sinensis TaxID=4442 RepID=A0A7J7GWM2_CAMSI|nr:hypothetical protein HYC85_015367 [Camellia sinensis]
MGSAYDMFGPRLASSTLLLLVSLAVYCFSIINSATSFLVVRFSLATFVATQFWISSMFSTTVVDTANAVFARWGNFGGGATQIIMPYDLLDGNFTDLKKSGEKHRDEISRVFRNAATNYRVWILALTYGYCFGVELTVDNIIAQAPKNYFALDPENSGPTLIFTLQGSSRCYGQEVRDERETVGVVDSA